MNIFTHNIKMSCTYNHLQLIPSEKLRSQFKNIDEELKLHLIIDLCRDIDLTNPKMVLLIYIDDNIINQLKLKILQYLNDVTFNETPVNKLSPLKRYKFLNRQGELYKFTINSSIMLLDILGN